MKLETFFEKFDQFADAPDAVAKMRELVLDLAVRGKLVVQNVRDEPAALLLERVLAEKNRRTGRSERSDDEPGSLADDEAFEIPANWEWIGATTPAVMVSDQGRKVQTKDILKAGKYPVVDQGKMFIRGYCDDADRVISVAEPIVLFGDHTRETKFIDFDFVVGADGVKLLQPICIDARFYFLVLRWLPLESRGYARHFKLLKAARIPLPPLAEQKRIVAKVDELMALCDRLEAQQQERGTRHAALARASLSRFADAPTPANLHFLFHPSYAISPADIRKSILTLAVQGKLVPQDPNDEPAEETFHGLRPVDPEPVDGSDVPNQWALCTYRSLTTIVTSGSRGWKEFYAETGAIFVRTQNIKTDKLVLDDVAFVDLPTSAEGMRTQVLKDDILITITGANVTKAARVEKQIPEAYVSQHIALTRPRWSKMSEWLHLCFISHGSARGMLEQLAYGDKPGLNLSNIRDLVLPIPPLAEQRRIVAKVEQLMALVDALELQLATSRATAEKLLAAVVAELTEGTHASPAC